MSSSPFFDIFPQSKKTVIILPAKTRPQITESLYLLILLHSYLSTLDINTTVSTWHEMIRSTSLSHFSYF